MAGVTAIVHHWYTYGLLYDTVVTLEVLKSIVAELSLDVNVISVLQS